MRRRSISLLCAGALLMGGVACGDDGDGDDDTSGTAPSTSETDDGAAAPSMPAGDAAIDPGTYRIPSSPWSVAGFSVTFPTGWSVQYGHVYTTDADTAAERGFYAVVVDEIFTDACEGEGEPMEVGPGVDDLVTALQEQPGPEASEPVDTTLGGRPATRIDLTIPQDLDLETCRFFVDGIRGLQVWYSSPADKYFVLLPDATASVYVLDVDGERQVFLTQVGSAATDEDRSELQAVLDSISIDA